MWYDVTLDRWMENEKKITPNASIFLVFSPFHSLYTIMYIIQNVWIKIHAKQWIERKTKNDLISMFKIENLLLLLFIQLLKQSIACIFTIFLFHILRLAARYFYFVLFEEYCAWGCDKMILYGHNNKMILKTGWNIPYSMLNIYKIDKIVLLPCMRAPESGIRKRHGNGKKEKKWTRNKK